MVDAVLGSSECALVAVSPNYLMDGCARPVIHLRSLAERIP